MNQPTNNKPENSEVSEAFERQVFRALVEKGHVIPETEAEVREAEDRIEAQGKTMPKPLRDDSAMLARIKGKKKAHDSKVVPIPLSHFAEAGEELARAARKGTGISPEIEEKMRRNRAKADATRKRSSESE